MVVVLLLGMPEFWHRLTPYDVWAADQIAVGLLVLLLAAMSYRMTRDRLVRLASRVAAVLGVGRSACTAVWPNASDAQGSICDSQLGLPLTLALLVLTLLAMDRMRR